MTLTAAADGDRRTKCTTDRDQFFRFEEGAGRSTSTADIDRRSADGSGGDRPGRRRATMSATPASQGRLQALHHLRPARASRTASPRRRRPTPKRRPSSARRNSGRRRTSGVACQGGGTAPPSAHGPAPRHLRPAQRDDPDQRQRRAEAARRGDGVGVRLAASCSATASGRGCASVGGRIAFLDRHLDRLFEGAKAIALDIGLDRAALTERLYDTLDANGMDDGVHVRLMVTRGVRSTPYQDPRVVVGGATIVIIPEYKEPPPELRSTGPQAVHRPRPPRRPGGAGPQAQFALASSTASPPASRRSRRAPTRR